tara:strand:+ start:403 stop:1299 length:897 start_codon:yes stop_codon:yes gene_type:complete
MKAALIGSTKIAEIHLRELIANGCKEITIISRDRNKANQLIKKFKFYNKIKFFNSQINILKKKKFNIIDICSNTDFHLKHINYIPKFSGTIIVEKPIFSLIKYNKNYLHILTKIYKKHKKIYVCYPMKYFAKIILSKFKFKKKISKFKVNYHTSGKHFESEIGLDLLPHAISITSEIFKDSNFNEKKIINNFVKTNKHKWNSKTTYEKLKIYYNFSENKKRKKSQFSLQIDEKKLTRYTKKINHLFYNYIKFNNEKISVDNPMKIMFKDFFKNIKKVKFFNDNRKLTYLIMNQMHNLL